jgi:hypothetical protein
LSLGSTGIEPSAGRQICPQPGLDLTCTKVAVDFQSITITTAAERLRAGLQSLTEACGADAVFIALLDAESAKINKVYAGRSTFSACNPEVLLGLDLAELPWVKGRLDHLRLLEIRDTSKPPLAQSHDAERLMSFNGRRAARRGLQHLRAGAESPCSGHESGGSPRTCQLVGGLRERPRAFSSRRTCSRSKSGTGS